MKWRDIVKGIIAGGIAIILMVLGVVLVAWLTSTNVILKRLEYMDGGVTNVISTCVIGAWRLTST